MKKTTETMIASVLASALASDGALTQTMTDKALAILQGRAEAVETNTPPDLGAVIRTRDVQKRLGGVTSKCLRNYAARGLLTPVFGGSRRLGYTAESVAALMQRSTPVCVMRSRPMCAATV